jgi:ferritin-like metal-binding protein YciE
MPNVTLWTRSKNKLKPSPTNSLKKAITDHRAQTEKQVERLEQFFEDLGEEPEEVSSPPEFAI